MKSLSCLLLLAAAFAQAPRTAPAAGIAAPAAERADRLPVKWPSAAEAPIVTCPNPLNPKKHVVPNSGFRFADFAAKSNSLETPKLPDYAVWDRASSKIVLAGFFNEDRGM